LDDSVNAATRGWDGKVDRGECEGRRGDAADGAAEVEVSEPCFKPIP